jgi:hypothetical protein
MATQLELVQARVADMLRELTEQRKDGETMYLIGVLGGRILMDARQPRWVQMKRNLSRAAYDQILLTAQLQGNDLFKEENLAGAFALDVIVTSIVASRFEDQRLAEGVALIDATIEQAIGVWRKSNASPVN